ncbi:MAG: hypothetical protein HY863_15690 [Chloroflexi bacterium]|nr:hypothetical protein [Chloroflexota bacterium]
MNYSMKVNVGKSPNGINLRAGAGASFADIGDLNVGQIAEGDEMVKDVNNQEWLHILMIDGKQTSTPTYAAAWLCDVTVVAPPPPMPTVQVDLSFVSETPITIVANGVPIGTYTGTIALVAKA